MTVTTVYQVWDTRNSASSGSLATYTNLQDALNDAADRRDNDSEPWVYVIPVLKATNI